MEQIVIARDTRDRIDRHKNVDDGLAAKGIKTVRTKLYVGDVARLDNMTVAIDLKQGLSECYNNIISDHARFIRECKRAQEAGVKLVILCEQAGISTVQDVAAWINPRMTKWTKLRDAHKAGKRMNEPLNPYPPVSSERLAKAMQTISERYGVEWRFCAKTETVNVICEVLGIG